MWRANGNPNPCTDLDEILHAHSYLSKEGFDAGLTFIPSHPLAWGPEPLKPEGQRCSAGCILTRAAPGTSAINKYKYPVTFKILYKKMRHSILCINRQRREAFG